MKVLSYGSLNIDRVYDVPHFVRPGESLFVAGSQTHAGGKGLNQSLALARGGAEVAHAGKIGADGEFLREILRENGVDTHLLLTDPEQQSGHALIQVNPEGENCILVVGGTNQRIQQQERRAAIAEMQPGDYLLAQNELNDTAALLSEAAEAGLRVVLNPAPFSEDVPELPLQNVHTLIVNEVEGEGLTGERDEEKIARKIRGRWGNSVIIVTLGSRGSFCLEEGQPEPVRIEPPHVDAVDTTAAGDCFIGYYLASKLQGLSTREALQRATRASAICVTRAGAAPSIPQADEV